MAQIYQGNKFRTSVTQSARGNVDVSNLANRGVQETLDRKKAEAVQLYEQGLKLSAAQGMEEIYKNNENDPETLKAELNKLNEKMTSEIPDMRMKVAFKTNFILQSGSLVNRAQANYDRIQYQKKKSSYFDTIQANNKAIATALNNAFNGTGTADDLANYQIAIKQNLGLINARNDDGTYMFTDAQRLSMSNAVDKLAAESFSAALNEMDDNKRQALMDDLKNDSFVMLKSEKDGTLTELNLKDAFSPDIYADMKKSAKILDNKIKKERLAEYDFNKKYSTMMLNTEGGEENYKIWEFYHKDATADKKAQMRGIAGFVPDEETVTNYEGYSDAYDEIKELSKWPNDTQEEKEAIMTQASNIVQKLHLSNHRKDNRGKAFIGSKDLEKLKQDINNLLVDNVYKEQISKLPNMSTFSKLMNVGQPDDIKPIDVLPGARKIRGMGRAITAKSEIGKIGQKTMALVQDIARNPEIDPETKEKEISKVYKKGVEAAIKAKYYWIPDLQQPLVKDETIININGTQYLYKGIGDDIFLEIKE